ncbi:hypothetical protein SARC_00186 [Sphaeroforma arctica JP610]|uniref:Uncharacterized protein n=1 Tax=Sphaeroforma arctica JP610 TaxID=667725 RepID=A0A0L0GH74_9EUKA|nr:hypothetical protein SARC_00186 [Sphaeroforma arctica JP610]KNC87678.1 hypothetical protein SARC_00186 [Sphaeroforma arctica JP610]|eukprot:XP_014161580.1 hypothetical protein SARC_00186 [Sphaeroforma arctica JP610]
MAGSKYRGGGKGINPEVASRWATLPPQTKEEKNSLYNDDFKIGILLVSICALAMVVIVGGMYVFLTISSPS